MAGPGGGPPRKSHTKSRFGCRTCKRRHIRCDETFPQCGNCTKHNCRCDYMDVATVHDESTSIRKVPDLLMSAEIEMEIKNWHLTGLPPYPELMHFPRNCWGKLSRTDLRLIHHIIGLSIDLHRRGLSNCTIWAQKMPLFLSIAISHDFVMSSILTLSAAHLAWITRNQETKQLAFHHRGTAIQGLQKAIGAFSRENCDGILAASILLSWQDSEWPSWASLQQGVTSVLDSMPQVWKQESELALFLDNQRYMANANSPVISGYRFQDEDLASLDHTIITLQSVQKRVAHNHEHYRRVGELLEFVRHFQRDILSLTAEQAFERVQPLRQWLFWLPPAMLRGGDGDTGALAILAQFFGVGVALDTLFPDLGGAYLGPLSVGPIEEIYRTIYSRNAATPYNPDVQLAMSLMDLPRHLAAKYRARLHWSPRTSVEYYSPPPTSPFQAIHDYRLASSASPSSTSAPYTPYTPPLQSPPAVTIASSPFEVSAPYVTASAPHSLYPSPRLLSDPRESPSDCAHPTSLQQSSPYPPSYLEDIVCGGVPRVDGGLGLHPLELYEEHPSVVGEYNTPDSWSICT
ncbi:putative C6 transcription factor RosA-like [Aspergillus lucknowensis]|uniref:Zn(2)-C6 fungal-type domain-containing protein n=1 Tax=Aspergillus lucknowensis TaxID=176173 RepID=A0ABR4M5H1_9EURO